MKSRVRKTALPVVLFSIALSSAESLPGLAQTPVKPAAVPSRLLADLRSRDGSVRRNAANELGSLRAKQAVRALLLSLSDRDGAVREAAAFALGQITDPAAADAVIRAMRDRDPEVRASAAFALGMLEDSRSTNVLSEALEDGEAAVRASAVMALGLMGDQEALDEIIQMLDDPSFDVRYDAVWALGHLGEPQAADHLRAALITIDFIRADAASRELFRQAVQTALENLRFGDEVRASRPRRVSEGAQNGSDPLWAVRRPSAVRQMISPAATERAIDSGVGGAVGLKVLVGADGRPVRAYVTRRLGYGLDQRAVQAVLRYKFDPAMADGLPQTEWVNLDVRFSRGAKHSL